MKHETPTITAQQRERSGSRYAQRLRKAGRLPGVVYGHKTPPVSVSVDEKEIIGLVQHGAHAMYLDIAGVGKETCLVKALQYGYLGDNIIHVDFARVNFSEEVEVRVHLEFVGESHEAQRADALLRHDLNELTVKCKVSEIPESIRVDLSRMEGLQLAAGEVPLPAGVELIDDPTSLVASVSFLRAEEAVGEEVDVEGSAEPEVITEAKADEGRRSVKLIVGLGNPGTEYDHTRHNVGFVVLDRLARRWAPGETARSKFHGAVLDGRIETGDGDARVLLIKPATYMNRSGLSIAEAVRFYKLDPAESVLVIVDDVALECGLVRVKPAGGAGGHNGLTDIEQKLGTDRYARLRIGIDGPGQIPQKDYVLGRFRPDQLDALAPALEDAAEAAACWAVSGCLEAMNRFNRRQSA